MAFVTPQEFIRQMSEIQSLPDMDAMKTQGLNLVLKVLKENGFSGGADIFELIMLDQLL